MTMKKRITSLLLAAGMTFSLAACSTPAAEPTDSPAPSEEIVADLSRDILDFSAGLKGDETMLTANGEVIPADLYLYFLAVNCAYLTQMYQADVADYADQLKEDSKTVTAYYKILEAKCEELGCPLTDEQQTELNETLMSEGQEKYDQRKTINGLSDETMKFVYSRPWTPRVPPPSRRTAPTPIPSWTRRPSTRRRPWPRTFWPSSTPATTPPPSSTS